MITDIHYREDDFSLQLTSDISRRFFIRLLKSGASKQTMVFSDFILESNDSARGIEALRLLTPQFEDHKPVMKLVFQNIYPGHREKNDRCELVRRHDQIVEVVRGYASESGLAVSQTILEPKAEGFETVILVEQR
ncbi:hypothetical protein M4578_25365 [Salipiger sp. P9]|uniref:hypothetical protein n=1 Tax=Salipiger pentaromativorans TaxID=2943193 RepID=UPI002158002D|nr:hypothetical protein [Salipiger pentaromativorans]MCR8551159.1 hypothetical protein [Salipiger pentaromativorans]